jgi:hypothetical protein
MSLVSQEPNRTEVSAWQWKAAHKLEDVGSHYKILWDSVTSCTQQPQSSTLRLPPIWSREEYIVIDGSFVNVNFPIMFI